VFGNGASAESFAVPVIMPLPVCAAAAGATHAPQPKIVATKIKYRILRMALLTLVPVARVVIFEFLDVFLQKPRSAVPVFQFFLQRDGYTRFMPMAHGNAAT
jgi:hypothetical protein